MAKRPPSTPTAEEEVVKALDTVDPQTVDAAENDAVASAVTEPAAMSEPVIMEEPRRFEADPAAPEPVEQKAEAEPDFVPPPPTPIAEKKGGSGAFFGTVLGGVVAAAAGYALATFVPFPGSGTSDVPLATQADVQALAARINTLESAPPPDDTLADRIAALEARPVQDAPAEPDLSPLTEALAALEDRVSAIESQGQSAPGEGPSADLVAQLDSLRAEVAEMKASGADANAGLEALAAETQARLTEAEAQASALRAEAEETARKAVSAAALARVQAAMDSGAPFAAALADIPDVEIPDALVGLADLGVPTRAALEEAFPPAARAALEASLRADMGEGWSDRLGSFLQATTGARSLTPREGTDPDAVLSRAEAALRSGDLAKALTELEGLPPEGQAEMSGWTTMARQRLDAVSATSALSVAVEG